MIIFPRAPAQVFVESKLWFTELGFYESLGAVERSLQRLHTPYIDAYLIHWWARRCRLLLCMSC
jgi:diketogulonate reductase-like aldo/keto reductase